MDSEGVPTLVCSAAAEANSKGVGFSCQIYPQGP